MRSLRLFAMFLKNVYFSREKNYAKPQKITLPVRNILQNNQSFTLWRQMRGWLFIFWFRSFRVQLTTNHPSLKAPHEHDGYCKCFKVFPMNLIFRKFQTRYIQFLPSHMTSTGRALSSITSLTWTRQRTHNTRIQMHLYYFSCFFRKRDEVWVNVQEKRRFGFDGHVLGPKCGAQFEIIWCTKKT